MASLILKTATRLLAALILTFAVYLLLRGHHLPGGGFAGALVAGTGFALFAISEGSRAVRRAIVLTPQHLTLAGLGLALVAGLLGPLAGKPVLTGLWWFWGDPHAPLVELGTPLLFDVGVFLTVLGTVLTLILALEES